MPISNSTPGHWVSEANSVQKLWAYSSTLPNPGYYRATGPSLFPGRPALLYYYNNYTIFSPAKNYIFRTGVGNFGPGPQFLQFQTPWNTGDTASFHFTQSTTAVYPYPTIIDSTGIHSTTITTCPIDTGDYTLIHMASPPNIVNLNQRARWKSSNFNTGRIKNVEVLETDWIIHGYSIGTASKSVDDEKFVGWRYANKKFTYHFTNDAQRRLPGPYNNEIIPITIILPMVGPVVIPVRRTVPVTVNNYIANYIALEKFNLEFRLSFPIPSPPVPADAFVDIWTLPNLPSSNIFISPTFSQSFQQGQYIGRINSEGTFNFYSIEGNRYLVIVANYGPVGGSNYRIEISNLKVTGGYSLIDNNKKLKLTNTKDFINENTLSFIDEDPESVFQITTNTSKSIHINGNETFGPTGGTGSISGFYGSIYGTITDLASINSKVGNSAFRAGIWENGVWNNGWRDDENVYEFNDVKLSIAFSNDSLKWRVQISGPSSSVSQFSIGDKVAIGNIVAIDINENRKLLKNYHTIVDKNQNNLVIEVKSPFPFRRIEKDSDNHKILMTKNVWLNGAFFNGYFQGVWNNGLFRGYPYITEMYDSHWIDGQFNGGHFSSQRQSLIFSDTIFFEGVVSLNFGNVRHGLKVGETVEIDKDDKTVNSQYDGFTTVLQVIDDYTIAIDRPWGSNSNQESGRVYKQSTGVIQNFKFEDGNVAPKNSKQSTFLKDIWRFNSWIDVDYSDQSSTNIGRNKFYHNDSSTSFVDIFNKNKLNVGDFSPLNLYGFITEDVLSAEATFRDMDLNVRRTYSLGTKYQIYQDFLGDISNFELPFGTTNSFGGLQNFFSQGWTYSTSGLSVNPITFSRTVDGTFRLEFGEFGAQSFVLNNSNIDIAKNRYSVVEFDYLRGPESYVFNTTTGQKLDFHYIDLFNYTNFAVESGNDLIYGPTHAFPNPPTTNNLSNPFASAIDYKNTRSQRKVDYFYNRRDLDLVFMSTSFYNSVSGYQTQSYVFEIDNIKFYEVDRIPFFQYTTQEYVNKQVQVPLQGVAPQIDYEDAGFSFVDNIDVGIDSIILNPSNQTLQTVTQETEIIFNPPLNG